MSNKKKIIFIVNPKSGTDRQKHLQEAVAQNLDLTQFDYTIAQTTHKGHGTEIAKAAAGNGFDIVVAVGGDGSVNDIIKGLYTTDITLAIIPKGSGNGLARALQIPLDEVKAIQLINRQRIEKLDLGTVNGSVFVSNAGIGFDALVAEKFAHSKGRGLWNYVLLTIKSLRQYRHKDCTITIDDKTIHCKESFIITVANTEQFGYNFKIAPLADYKDGLLELIVLKKFPLWRAVEITIKAFSGKLLQSKFVQHYKGRHISITTTSEASLQIDGDYIASGDASFRFQLLPQKLKVIVGDK